MEEEVVLQSNSMEEEVVVVSHHVTLAAPQATKARGKKVGIAPANPPPNKPQVQKRKKKNSEEVVNKTKWKDWETCILLESKKKFDMLLQTGGIHARVQDPWPKILEFCHARDVRRTSTQCKDKWEKVFGLFNKLYDFERKQKSGASSFWRMPDEERTANRLPIDHISLEVYKKMLDLFRLDRQVNPGSIVVDAMAENTGNEDVTNVVEGSTTPANKDIEVDVEDAISKDGSATGKARRRARRLSGGHREFNDTIKQLMGVFETQGVQKAERFQQAEVARENQEAKRAEREASARLHVEQMECERMEAARDMTRENTAAICNSLNSIAMSLAALSKNL